MREAVFLRNNEKKWRMTENMLAGDGRSINPDKLADLYIELTDDLAYAQTNYPDSKTTVYLNGLTAEIYQAIYRNKKERTNRFTNFWLYELPREFYKSQRQLLYSLVIFCLSMGIGIVSTSYDDSFTRVILGDDYVNMTLANIEKGDPLAVYKDPEANIMFFAITINNILVAFTTFVSGIFYFSLEKITLFSVIKLPFTFLPLSLGTAYMLFHNGVMVGAFQWFFYDKGLLLDSFLIIWIHGALEISAIVIAGGAGFVIGNSVLFPGTHSRISSLLVGAKRAVKICIGLVPVFIMAGFLESYVTRFGGSETIGFKDTALTMPTIILQVTIIVVSFSFVIFYFGIYPVLLNRRSPVRTDNPMTPDTKSQLEK